ncbi:MAG: hypothetical protein D6814_12435, partial [Calditrichaeota bacterium]
KLREKKIQAYTIAPGQEMIQFLSQQAQPGDIFVFMSNGDFLMMPIKLANALKQKREARGMHNE